MLLAVFAAETGFLLSTNPDTVRAPDVAFVRQEVLDREPDTDGYLRLAPDLVAEVLSPNDASAAVQAKVNCWLGAGTTVVVVADPAERTVSVHRVGQEPVVMPSNEELVVADVVPGWALRIADLFGNA